MHPMDPVVKTASCSQLTGSAALVETTVICLSSAQEIVPSAPLTSDWGTVSLVLVDRLYVCTGAVPPIPSSASRFGDLEPSLPHHFASKQPILGVMPLGAVGAAPMAATCPARLEMPFVDNYSASGVGASLCWAQSKICSQRSWKPTGCS